MVAEGDRLSERYRLDDRIAGGGMGAVYEATDERLGRTVALKLLRDELAEDPRFIERFRREARAAAALAHPNIANVYDYGEDGVCHYIVMEKVSGRNLAQLLRDDGPLEPERAAAIGAQIADALGHAHAAGVVHRDVKPANAIVDERDRVKVTDFGIARAMGESTLTATGTIMGTAAYLSPEQAQGTPVDARSDVYALGIVLYELLTGEAPFTGDSAVSIAMKHISVDVPRPRQERSDIPEELDEIVATATAKDPGERYSDGAALATALRNFLREKGRTAAVAGAGAMAPTEAMASEGGTRALPLPTGPYDAYKLGRAVLIALVGLAALAAILLLWRLAQDDGERARATDDRPGTSQPAEEPEEPSPTPTPEEEEPEEEEGLTFEIPDWIIGIDAKDAEKALEAAGFEVVEEEVDSDADKHTIVATDPEPGSTIAEGDTITLYVSNGKGSEEEDDD